MDFLLAGTLSSFIHGVSMPGICPASQHLLLFVCGKHSAPSRTPFRQATKTVRLPTGIGQTRGSVERLYGERFVPGSTYGNSKASSKQLARFMRNPHSVAVRDLVLSTPMLRLARK